VSSEGRRVDEDQTNKNVLEDYSDWLKDTTKVDFWLVWYGSFYTVSYISSLLLLPNT
jgi:hypothetical protein